MLPLLASALLAVVPLQAACPETTGVAEVMEAVEAAEEGFSRMDRAQVLAGADAARAALPCLNEVLSTPLAADLHRAVGLALFLERDVPHARMAFAASRSLSSASRLPERLAPAGNPIQEAFVALPLDALATENLPPTSTVWFFDGREAAPRPNSVPTLFQVLDDEGAVGGTWLLGPGEPLPAGTLAPPPLAPPLPPPRSTSRGLMAGAGATTAAAAVLYGLSFRAGAAHGQATDIPSLDQAYATNHALVLTSAGVGLTAVGLGLSALVVARW